MAHKGKAIHLVFGSEGDLPHVQKVVAQLKENGWKYATLPIDADKMYTVGAGSVHRDLEGTIKYVNNLKDLYTFQRRIYLTCIGLRDEASGVIASYTGLQVVALPPDVKEYGNYPKGVRVTTFSKDVIRENDIGDALKWIETAFDNPTWNDGYIENHKIHYDKRSALLALREKIEKKDIQF